MIEKERLEKLQQELRKVKSQSKLIMGVAGISVIAAIILGTIALQKSTPVTIVPDTAAIGLDEVDTIEEIDETVVLYQQIDSLGIVIDTLANRLAQQEAIVLASQETVVITDYIGQLLDNARAFSGVNCTKSLAFLYAAKKIAQTDGTSDANKSAMAQMISQCEAALFGAQSNNNSATSSINESTNVGGQ